MISRDQNLILNNLFYKEKMSTIFNLTNSLEKVVFRICFLAVRNHPEAALTRSSTYIQPLLLTGINLL